MHLRRGAGRRPELVRVRVKVESACGAVGVF